MYLENNFSTQAAQCTLAVQEGIGECRSPEETALATDFTKSTLLAQISHKLR